MYLGFANLPEPSPVEPRFGDISPSLLFPTDRDTQSCADRHRVASRLMTGNARHSCSAPTKAGAGRDAAVRQPPTGKTRDAARQLLATWPRVAYLRSMAELALRVGAHTSIAGGLHKALERGAAAGCDVVQVFTSSSQQWRTKELTDQDVERWSLARERTGVEPALAHDSYLINVASPDRALWHRSYRALAAEYERCLRLSIPCLVMHPGAHLERGIVAGIERVARAVNRLHAEQPDNRTRILFENTAGQGTSIGHRFEHLRDLLAAVQDRRRIGLCIDTCHALAAGYDIRTARGWDATFAELERVVGCNEVRAFHVNDSKTPVGSRVDRHAHLGRGNVGLVAFHSLVNDERFVGLPMVLETPKPSDWADKINLSALRALHGRQRVSRRARLLATQSLHRRPVA